MIYRRLLTKLNNYFFNEQNKNKEIELTAFLLIVDDIVDFASSLFKIVQLISDALMKIRQYSI